MEADTSHRQAAQEDAIYQKETEYLENTPAGNIITGFDAYTKGTGGTAAAARGRKTGQTDANRVFSRSSISYNANAVTNGSGDAQTPGSAGALSTPASHAPTPLSTSFRNGAGGESGVPTPTSATATKAPGKKNKKAATGGEGQDSETDGREAKKIRTNFGAARK
jgi:chromatin modification-related protein EAF6